MRRRLQIILVLSAWFLATGSQWDVAQVFAWGRMFTAYSREMTVAAAVEKTFTGEMCPVCKAVQKARQEQTGSNKAPGAKAAGKLLDACPVVTTTVVPAPSRSAVAHVLAPRVSAGRDRVAPPLPPPRTAV